MAESRLENTKRNIIFGLAGKIVQLLFKFLLRTAVIYIFGVAYLGLDALFLNVLSVLCIAELGISNAVCYALYKPFAQSEETKLRAYITLYRRIYRILGWVVLFLGLCFLPCLKYIIHLDRAIDMDYRLAYVIFLLNAVISYWFGAYTQVLFIADQKTRIVDNIKNLFYVITVVMEVLAIIIFKNYYIYLIIMVAGSLSANLAVYTFAKRRYQILLKGKETLSEAEFHELKRNITAMALMKLSSVIYTSSDNILISSLVGTVMVGYYSNYAYVVSAVTGIISLIFNGAVASIGNVNIAEKPEKKKLFFKRMLFLNYAVYGFCYVCMFVLFSDLIRVWAGEAYVFLQDVTQLICLLFLISGLNHTCAVYNDACGLFWKIRYRALGTAGVNIFLSFILGKQYGLPGILAATIFSYFLTTFIVDPKVIYRTVFKQSSGEFYRWYALSLGKSWVIGLAVKRMLCFIIVRTWWSLIIKIFLCAAVTAGLFFMTSYRSQESRYFRELIKNEIRNDKNKEIWRMKVRGRKSADKNDKRSSV